jgi:hypothetical protein
MVELQRCQKQEDTTEFLELPAACGPHVLDILCLAADAPPTPWSQFKSVCAAPAMWPLPQIWYCIRVMLMMITVDIDDMHDSDYQCLRAVGVPASCWMLYFYLGLIKILSLTP